MPGILETLGIDSTLPPPAEENLAEQSEQILNFDPREKELELLCAEAESVKASAAERVRIWLELSDLHRWLAYTDPSQKRARLKQSEMVARKAVEIAAQAKDTFGYLSGMDALADSLAAQNKFPSAEKILNVAIKMEATMPHPDAFRTAQRLHLIGVLRQRAGRPQEAIPVLEKALKLHEKSRGPNHERTIQVLAQLGAAHRAKGSHVAAQKALKYALRHLQNTAPSVLHSDVVEVLFQLAGSYEESGKIDLAGAEYERLLTLVNYEVGRQLEEIAELQFSVATRYMRWGSYARARELLAYCCGAFKRTGGARLAVAHETLAHVEEASGHYFEAIAELATAGKVWAKLGNRNAELAVNMYYRAELLEMLRMHKDAKWLRDQAEGLQAHATMPQLELVPRPA